MHIKKGDTVKVISGKDKGKVAKVIEVCPDTGKIRVEGVAMVKRHYKPQKSRALPEGGILEKAALIPASKVMLYSEALKRPVRVGHQVTDKGTKKRVARGRGVKATVLD
jgi:large subunit ribosomal protein L24